MSVKSDDPEYKQLVLDDILKLPSDADNIPSSNNLATETCTNYDTVICAIYCDKLCRSKTVIET